MWEGPYEVLSERQGVYEGIVGSSIQRFVHVGDELWVTTSVGRTAVASRSIDGGKTWVETTIATAGSDEQMVINHVLPKPGGGYLAVVNREFDCYGGSTDVAQRQVCMRDQPVVYTSDDADTWVETTPVGWALEPDSSLKINSVVTSGDGFWAAGTVEGPKWRGVLYSSADGTNWTTEREFELNGHPTTSVDLVYDGTVLTYIANESPCGTPWDSPGGWVLGSFWERHGRIFTGTDIGSLTLQQPGEHPLAPEPFDPPEDCGSIDGVPYAAIPYPRFRAELIDGVATLFEEFVPPAQTEAVDAAQDGDAEDLEVVRNNSGTRRYAELVDGAWEVVEVTGVTVPDHRVPLLFFDFDGAPAFADVRRIDASHFEMFSVTGGAQAVSVTHPLVATVTDVTAVGDTLVVLGTEVDDPFSLRDWSVPTRIVVWTSTAGEGSLDPPCDMAAGGVCRFSDLTTHPDYPDFSGRDLAAIDLSGTYVGSANFDGANLRGARAWRLRTDGADPASFVGADLTDSRLQRAFLGDISDARVQGANFRYARLERAGGVDFSTSVVTDLRLDEINGATFGNADLTGATLGVIGVSNFPSPASLRYDRISITIDFEAGEPNELDLSGVDLTGLRLSGPILGGGLLDDRYLVITSLDGAIIDRTHFSVIDLSRVGPNVDLSGLVVEMGSVICPDGGEPEGGIADGSCDRD